MCPKIAVGCGLTPMALCYFNKNVWRLIITVPIIREEILKTIAKLPSLHMYIYNIYIADKS